MIEILIGNLFFPISKTKGVHYLLQVEIFLADVEPQFVHDHLDLVLELSGIALCKEVASEDGMYEDFIP